MADVIQKLQDFAVSYEDYQKQCLGSDRCLACRKRAEVRFFAWVFVCRYLLKYLTEIFEKGKKLKRSF